MRPYLSRLLAALAGLALVLIGGLGGCSAGLAAGLAIDGMDGVGVIVTIAGLIGGLAAGGWLGKRAWTAITGRSDEWPLR